MFARLVEHLQNTRRTVLAIQGYTVWNINSCNAGPSEWLSGLDASQFQLRSWSQGCGIGPGLGSTLSWSLLKILSLSLCPLPPIARALSLSLKRK